MRHPMLSPLEAEADRVLDDVARALVSAEREIALLSRCTPPDAAAECARLVDAWQRRTERQAVFRYPRWRARRGLVRGLERFAAGGGDHGLVGELLAERARELLLDVELAESLGTGRFGALARERYGAEQGERDADELAGEWVEEGGASMNDGARIPCDDACDPRSLVTLLRAEIGRLRLPIRVEVSGSLLATAAAAPGVVTIAAGRTTTVLDARRIAAHELFGHCVPMLNAERLPPTAPHRPLLVAGSARGTEAQEGWALWVEERLGLLHPGRRRTLALRHVAARRTSRGESFVDVMRALLDLGSSVETAVRIALRAQRGGDGAGGGLAREVVYLRSAIEVTAACRLEAARTWLQLGRVSLDAATRLESSLPASVLVADGACLLDDDVVRRWSPGADCG